MILVYTSIYLYILVLLVYTRIYKKSNSFVSTIDGVTAFRTIKRTKNNNINNNCGSGTSYCGIENHKTMSSLCRGDFVFKHPTAIQVSGPSGCGKTRFVLRVLENQLIEPFPSRIIWAFGERQPDYERAFFLYPCIEFVRGWHESIYDRLSPETRNLLIVDDLMDEAGSSKSMKALFTKGAHHRNCTVLYLLQNMYHQGTSQRTASLNTHYNVVFRNARDMCQFRTLASQMFPGQFYWLLDAFDDATRRPFGYLVLDTHPRTLDDGCRALTGILPHEQLTYYSRRNERAL